MYPLKTVYKTTNPDKLMFIGKVSEEDKKSLYKQKIPTMHCMSGFVKSGIDLLSHPQKGSTISANGLNFSVRNGKGWTSLL